MRRLYRQIYTAFLLVAALCVLVAGGLATLFWWDGPEIPAPARGAAAWLGESLPPPNSPEFQPALAEIGERLSLDLTLWDARGELLGASGPPLPRAWGDCRDEGWTHAHRAHGFLIRLADGRCLGASYAAAGARRGRHLTGFLVFPLMFGVVALGCYPLARRITLRLELLQRSMDRFGQGDLGARAEVIGRDEVADLSRTFNAAAARVEALVLSQRRVLASASHELRSPLARLRVALELLEPGDDDPERRGLHDEAVHDIEELDGLIGDLLLGARLEARALTPRLEALDLGALLVAEAARTGASFRGDTVTVQADPSLMRSLARNLLENARRHGGDAVELWLEPGPERLVLVVADRGPGVAEADRERIFEPFFRAPGHREADGGVGLGLALVRWIAEAHGGTARCMPREGGGSRFEVELPLGPRP